MDLPFDPTFAVGPFRIAWHSFWALVGMGIGSWLSFRLARPIVRDERIYPFAIAVVVVLMDFLSARVRARLN